MKFVYTIPQFVFYHITFVFSLNSVLATGTNSFYFSNYGYYQNQFGAMFETLMMTKWTDVVYFNGQDYTVVAKDMLSPNGLAISKDGQ